MNYKDRFAIIFRACDNFFVNSSAKVQMNESFPLGLRGIEGVTLIISFYFI
jgi:hypothetical protein